MSEQAPALFPGNDGKHMQLEMNSVRHQRNIDGKQQQMDVKAEQVSVGGETGRRERRVLKSCVFSSSHSDQLLRERGARRQIQRGLTGKPEAVAVSEIRHGLLPVQGG